MDISAETIGTKYDTGQPGETLSIELKKIFVILIFLAFIISMRNIGNVSIQPTIKCIPLPHGEGSYSITLIPDDFQMLDNGRKMDFSISYQNRHYSVADSQKELAYEPSYIHFSLNFTPYESKTIIIKYKNDSNYYRDVGNIVTLQRLLAISLMQRAIKKDALSTNIGQLYFFS